MRKIVIAMLLAGMSSASSATIITVAGSFNVSDWQLIIGTAPPPSEPVFLSYRVTFDDSANIDNDNSGLSIINTNIPFALNFSFNQPNRVIVLGTNGSPTSCIMPVASFCALINDFSTGVPYFVGTGLPDQNNYTVYYANSVNPGLPGVPEPASWAMLIAGFGLVGAVQRRRALLAN